MAGYNGYSMSNNAVSAYEDGERPLSKWTKKDIIEAVKEINDKVDLSGLKVKELKDRCLIYSSYHHTSKFYNKTDFYEINEDVKDWTQDTVQLIIDERNSALNNEKIKIANLKAARELKEKGSISIYGCEVEYVDSFADELTIKIDDTDITWLPAFAPGWNNGDDIFTIVKNYKNK